MKVTKLFLCLVLCSVLIPTVLAGTVTRSLGPSDTAAPGGMLDVTLDVAVGAGETFYGFEETYPAGWTVVNKGELNDQTSGQLRIVVTSGAASKSYTYTLSVPSDATLGQFSGTYRFQGGSETAIADSDSITVQEESPPETISCTFYEDNDEDSYGNPNAMYTGATETVCADLAVRYITDNSDCDDTNMNINPSAAEICNGINDNCDTRGDPEHFNFETNENNCGSCDTVCPVDAPICSIGVCVASQEQQALNDVLTAIRSILESEDQPLDKLSSIAAQLFSYFS